MTPCILDLTNSNIAVTGGLLPIRPVQLLCPPSPRSGACSRIVRLSPARAKKSARLAVTAFAVLLSTTGPLARAQAPSVGHLTREADSVSSNNDRAEILDVLNAYQTALNTSNVDLAVGQFRANGALLSPNAPTAVGANAIRQSYQTTFQAISLNIVFDVAELVFVAPNWALLRSTSNGTIRINATGTVIPEANQELFLLKKSLRGEWKIARYSFSTTLGQ